MLGIGICGIGIFGIFGMGILGIGMFGIGIFGLGTLQTPPGQPALPRFCLAVFLSLPVSGQDGQRYHPLSSCHRHPLSSCLLVSIT